jgi:membrane-bound serine protease (ClpP class)
MRRARSLLALFLLALAGLSAAAAMAATPGDVRGVRFETEVMPVGARWIHRALEDAEKDGASLFVIQMDTPGGLDSSMREIVEDINDSPVNVVTWVGPSGARAASAGAYIAAASDFVAMAPGTNMGSATPVSGGNGGDLDQKIVNDAAAYIAAQASAHGRNADAYRRMVTKQSNLTAQEAVDQKVAEVLASSPEDLVAKLDGRIGKDGKPVELSGAAIRLDGMPWYLQILDTIADPNLIFLFFSFSLLAIGWEIFHPGAIVPGVVGAILFVLSLFGLSIIPFDWAGIVFIALAVGLFLAEIQVAGIGILAAGGVISLLVGGLILFDEPGVKASSPAVVIIALGVGGMFALLVRLIIKNRGVTPALGAPALVGALGEVRTPIAGEGGQVFVNGELWTARLTNGGILQRGEPVRVVNMEDLTLTVEPAPKEP